MTTAPTAAISGPSGQTLRLAEIKGRHAKPAADPKHPVVLIETGQGNVTVRLDADKAPLTVGNFLSYVRTGHYDQTIIHQIYKGQGFLAGGYGTNLAEKKPSTRPSAMKPTMA